MHIINCYYFACVKIKSNVRDKIRLRKRWNHSVESVTCMWFKPLGSLLCLLLNFGSFNSEMNMNKRRKMIAELVHCYNVFLNSFVLGVFTSLWGVYSKEGFSGLYKGNYVQMVRVFPYAAIQFMSYEQYRAVCTHTFVLCFIWMFNFWWCYILE